MRVREGTKATLELHMVTGVLLFVLYSINIAWKE